MHQHIWHLHDVALCAHHVNLNEDRLIPKKNSYQKRDIHWNCPVHQTTME